MPFDPDIVVRHRDSYVILLIAEAKLKENLFGSESQLKKYMWEMSCPVGLLVSPHRLFIFRNQFTGLSDDSVIRFGPFKTPEYWHTFTKKSPFVFERTVQHWLESIQLNIGTADVPEPTRTALSEHVLPSLINGEIHAARRRTFT